MRLWRNARHAAVAVVLAAVALLAVACAPKPPAEVEVLAPPPAVEQPQPAPPPAPLGLVSTRLDRFCNAVQRIVDGHAAGFAGLRGERDGATGWSGTVVPEGLNACRIEGGGGTGAEYVCEGRRVPAAGAALLLDDFDRISTDLDACLTRAAWFPRNWEGGAVITFAGDERRRTWRDLSPAPRPGIALNIDNDLLARAYSTRFAVFTIR